jgi:ribosomal protein S18 acetylase RimI-like enzyme
VRIRPARIDEAEAVADLYLRSRHASAPAIPPSVHPDDDVRDHFATTVLPTTETWVAEEDGVIVGLLVLDGGWIDHLYVEPGQTGRGIGSALVGHAQARRPEGLDLWAFQSNTGAQRFYERHGFVAVARTDGDNEEGAPDVRYRWTR